MLSRYLKTLLLSLLPLLILLLILLLRDATASTKLINCAKPHVSFAGRSKEIREIELFFDQDRSRVLTLSGFSGIGKTQIARKYIDLYKSRYDIVCWVDARSREYLDRYISDCTRELDEEKVPSVDMSNCNDRTCTFRETLSRTNHSWLIVFDDVKNEEIIENYIPIKTGKGMGHVLLTTNNEFSQHTIKTIGKFRRNESLELLSKMLENKDTKSLDLLASSLGDYPMPLVLAASYVKATGKSIETYVEIFKRRRNELQMKK